MGRIYIDSTIGTGQNVTVDLDPADYHWLDGIVDGTLLTTKTYLDPWRPANDPVGPNVNIPIMDSRVDGASYFLVMDAGVDVAPAGTIDLGAPGNTLDEIMPLGKANEIATLFGLTGVERDAMAANRIRKSCKWLRAQSLTRPPVDEFTGLPGGHSYRLWQGSD